MFIEVQHVVPPQHVIESTAGTRALHYNEIKKVQKYVSLRTGTFSKEENKLIRRNWNNFCKVNINFKYA
jgi:hypothetical protein